MKLLKDRIIAEGQIISDTAIRVDSFLNHQIDVELMNEVGKEFSRLFADSGVTKIVTVEASGIAVAIMAGLYLKVPVVFAKKAKPLTMADAYNAEVFSFTKQKSYNISVSKRFISSADRVLIIDDFLAEGHASEGLISIVNEQAGAEVVGIGIVIEKGFQKGGKRLRESGYRVESLVVVESLSSGAVSFA